MCIVFLALGDVNAHNRLTVLANRDELVDRATAPAHVWPDSGVIAGRDLEAGGTWLGLTPTGRFAAITNVRALGRRQSGARSRGDLVVQWLRGQGTPAQFADGLTRTAADYNPFNLVFGTLDQLLLYDGVQAHVTELAPGVHAVSNGSPSTIWPKMQRGLAAFEAAVATPEPDVDSLLAIARDDTRAADCELPDTGVSHAIEQRLSSIHIPLGDHGFGHYGTVSTTHLDWTADGGLLQEWNWRDGAHAERTEVRW